MSKHSRARQLIIETAYDLLDEGLLSSSWGNISIRVEKDAFAITPSGREYTKLTRDEIVEVSLEDFSWEGDIKPSSEHKLHGEVYRVKPEAAVIIHTHQHNASAISAMNLDAVKFDKSYPGIGDFITCSEYQMPGSPKLATSTAEAVAGAVGQAVIMKNHGAICYGRSPEEALEVAINLEEACGKYLESIGITPWTNDQEKYKYAWNKDPAIMKYMEHRDFLQAYLEDFAMFIGYDLRVIEKDDDEAIDNAIKDGRPLLVRGRGAFCTAKHRKERISQSIVIEKNCRAALAALGVPAINRADCLKMRHNYLKNYLGQWI